MNSIRLFATLFTLSILCGCAQTRWAGLDFDPVKSTIDTVAIIFPQIEYSEMNGDVGTPKVGFSMFVSKMTAAAIQEIIDEKHLLSTSAVTIYDTLLVGQWIEMRLAKGTGKYQPFWSSLHDSPNGKKTFPMTAEMTAVTGRIHSRYFLFVTGSAFGTSEATKQFDMQQRSLFKLLYGIPLSYEYQWQGLRMEMALVDARTQEVLWYNSNEPRKSNYDPLNQQSVSDLCLLLLQEGK